MICGHDSPARRNPLCGDTQRYFRMPPATGSRSSASQFFDRNRRLCASPCAAARTSAIATTRSVHFSPDSFAVQTGVNTGDPVISTSTCQLQLLGFEQPVHGRFPRGVLGSVTHACRLYGSAAPSCPSQLPRVRKRAAPRSAQTRARLRQFRHATRNRCKGAVLAVGWRP
jgi:hypothetical protein